MQSSTLHCIAFAQEDDLHQEEEWPLLRLRNSSVQIFANLVKEKLQIYLFVQKVE